ACGFGVGLNLYVTVSPLRPGGGSREPPTEVPPRTSDTSPAPMSRLPLGPRPEEETAGVPRTDRPARPPLGLGPPPPPPDGTLPPPIRRWSPRLRPRGCAPSLRGRTRAAGASSRPAARHRPTAHRPPVPRRTPAGWPPRQAPPP